jgi:predicted Zn-dependent peptidase
MVRRSFVLLAAAMAALPGPAVGAPAVPPARIVARPAPKTRIIQHRLPNGLRIVLSPDHVAPVVSLYLMYDVGSRNEREGKTGFAHLFEHLMFMGSENVGKGEHFALITENGGSFNGTTSQDRTVYYATVPSNQLDLVLFLEADRMARLDLTQENLDLERDVVKEERRQRVDNMPYGSMYEVSLQTFFNSFAYRHSTIGSMADLDNATLEDAREFYRTYYAPNNAVLVLVGDFDEKDALKKIAKHFGPIPRQPAPPPVEADEPLFAGERRQTITDNQASLPRFRRYYRTVRGDDPDFHALQVLATILAGRGKTGRLYQPIVESKVALSISAIQMEMRTNGPFQIEAGLAANGDVARLEETLEREIERVKAEGVTDEEMQRARIQLKTSAIAHVQEAQSKAAYLATYTLYYGDPDRVNTLYDRQEAVTAADVQRVARKYFTDDNSATIIVLPGRKPGEARPKPEPGTPPPAREEDL